MTARRPRLRLCMGVALLIVFLICMSQAGTGLPSRSYPGFSPPQSGPSLPIRVIRLESATLDRLRPIALGSAIREMRYVVNPRPAGQRLPLARVMAAGVRMPTAYPLLLRQDIAVIALFLGGHAPPKVFLWSSFI